MKRFVLTHLLLILCLSACQPTPPDYTINGKMNDFSGYVFLRYGEIVDSALVENGQFQFTGNVDHVVSATLTNAKNGYYTAPFFLGKEVVEIETAYIDSTVELIEVSSPSNALVPQVLTDLGGVMEDEKRLRSNELFLYMDSITLAHPRNEFVIELTTEVITSDFITFEQTNVLLENIDTTLIHPSDLISMRIALDRQSRVNYGDKFPEFNFEGLDGTMFTKESFPDQYLLIDVWATWCGPCIQGFQKLLPVYKALDGKLEVLAVSIDPTKDRVVKFVEQTNYPWKQAYAEGEWNNPFLQQLGVVFLPFYYLIAPNGEILAINPAIEDIPALIKSSGSLKGVLK